MLQRLLSFQMGVHNVKFMHFWHCLPLVSYFCTQILLQQCELHYSVRPSNSPTLISLLLGMTAGWSLRFQALRFQPCNSNFQFPSLQFQPYNSSYEIPAMQFQLCNPSTYTQKAQAYPHEEIEETRKRNPSLLWTAGYIRTRTHTQNHIRWAEK